MSAGQFYRWLDEAVPRAGSQRSLDSQDTTLSRRGLLIRADKRARELQGLKIGAGDVVALSMGNVAEFVILLLAVSKLGAIAMPVDPANGDRSLLGVASRLPVRAVLRRPRGLENSPLQYPEGYRLGARRKLSGSLLEVDILSGAERRVFPRPGSEEFAEGLYSYAGSHLDISKDRTRALVSFSGEGKGFEVDIATGDRILSYDSLHDLRGLSGTDPAATAAARRANLYGMYYTDEN